MAKRNITVEAFYGGSWQDITEDYVLAAEGINLEQGLSEESLEPQPGRMSFALLNPGGRWNPANPTSPLYGLVGRNTPLRVSEDGDVLQIGEAAVWSPSRPLSGPSRCKVTGAGILRRLGRGKTPLRPALERATLAGSPVGYWRLEDGEAATEAASGLPGGAPMSFDANVRPGRVEGTIPLGDGLSPEFMAGDGLTVSGRMQSSTLTSTASGAYAIDFAIRFQGGLGDLFGFDFGGWTASGTASSGVLRIFGVPAFGFQVFIRLNIGDDQEDVGVNIVDTDWHHVRFLFEQSGSNVLMYAYLDGVLVDSDTHSSTGTLGRPLDVALGGFNESGLNTIESLSARHLTVWDDVPPDTAAAASGYLGETAADRAERLCLEAGIPVTIIGDAAASHPLGPQGTNTLIELLLEAARTDAALLTETDDALGFTFRCGRDLYNQTPALELSFTGDGIAPGFDPTVGDTYVRNDVEAKSPRGGSGRAVRTTGPMSIQDPPDGVGRYDTTWQVNPADDGTLQAHAGWHMGRGTYAGIRFREVTVDLDANPAIGPALAALRTGDVVLLTDLDTDDSWEDWPGLVIRRGRRIGTHRHLVTLVLIPAEPYNVGIIGAAAGGTDVRGTRIGTDLTVTAEPLDTTETGVDTTGGSWSTNANVWNPALNGGGLFITIGGEVMRVTGRAGSTFTVDRSVNGVVKPHAAGAPVHVTYPARIGL